MRTWIRRLCLVALLALAPSLAADPILRVEAIGMTVSDMERAIDFYRRVLTFEKVSDIEVTGEAFERLQGVAIDRRGRRGQHNRQCERDHEPGGQSHRTPS